ncbi:hypothetical protein ACMYYO_01105 [Dermacoccaceae bacterium W4C1]
MADRLVRPYRMVPWSAGTMVTFAFVILPLCAVLAAWQLGMVREAGGFAAASTVDMVFLIVNLVPSGMFALYLSVASCLNAWRFEGLRRGVQSHYADLAQLAGRNPELDGHLDTALLDDYELHQVDLRHRVLSHVGFWVRLIWESVDDHRGPDLTDVAGEWRGPRAGQFGYKLFWGLVMLVGGAATLSSSPSYSPESGALAATVFVGLNLVWWLPSLWRSVALRRVDAAWRDGAEGVRERIPGDKNFTEWRAGG